MSRRLSSPTIEAEILGWKLDVAYSLGMSSAFFIAVQFQRTPLAFLSPYFDQIIAILIMLFMIPETIKMLVETFRELFLFSPDQQTVSQIKEISDDVLKEYGFSAVFYDIAKTGRKMWIAVYFQTDTDCVSIRKIGDANQKLGNRLSDFFPNISCELIPDHNQ